MVYYIYYILYYIYYILYYIILYYIYIYYILYNILYILFLKATRNTFSPRNRISVWMQKFPSSLFRHILVSIRKEQSQQRFNHSSHHNNYTEKFK